MKRIISYNINGIRAAVNKGLVNWIKTEKPDILFLQEIKADPEQIDQKLFEESGYFQYWNSAEKKGYSGVGLLTGTEPDNIEFGIGIKKYDMEGRLIRADFNDYTLIGTYFPSGTTGDIRQDFKMQWLNDFYIFINELKNIRSKLIISGDFNICHKEIDINHPEKHNTMSGFLPEEREWVSKFLNSGFIDTFRVFNNEPDQYTWWSYRARSREKNLGWRIDYHIVSEELKKNLVSSKILKEVVHSDHCPIVLEINF